MEIFNPHANFDFIGKKNVFIAFSIFLVIGSLISIFKPGLKFGIDFSGGTEVQIQFNKSIDSAEVRKILNDSGFKDSSVQHLGVAGSQEFLIRLEQTSGNLKSLQDDVAKTFTKSQGEGSFNIKKIEVWHNKENDAMLEKLDVGDDKCGGVPFFLNQKTGKTICGGSTYKEIKNWAEGR